MKKIIILLSLLALSFFTFSCGGGSGGSSSPSGENPGIPSSIQVLPSHYVGQTNSVITLHAKVLDGNGKGVGNVTVWFTNLSPIGVLSATSANTDASGIATVTIESHVVGFATIQAEVNKGVSNVRDRTLVYYSDFALMWPQPQIVIEIDADGDGIYNEPGDFNFFETPTDDLALLRATAYDEFGKRVVGIDITFSGDSGASFPLGNVFKTNSNGQAFTTLKVSPTSVVGQETSLNLYATGYISGSSATVGFLQVFLKPVYITGITLVANPSGVIAGETSTVTATITTSAGTLPDDLAVQFSVSPVTLGSVEPIVALTNNGSASTVFTPSDTQTGTATITASIANFSDTTDIVVTTELAVTPDSQTLTNPAVGATAIYTISGGLSPYTATSSNTSLVTVAVTGTTLTATVAAVPMADTDVEITVTDSVGRPPVTVTLTLDVSALSISPTTADVTESASAQQLLFQVSGGGGTYTITSSNPTIVFDTAAGDGVWAVTTNGGTFTAHIASGDIVECVDSDVTLTVTDLIGSPIVTAKITIKEGIDNLPACP